MIAVGSSIVAGARRGWVSLVRSWQRHPGVRIAFALLLLAAPLVPAATQRALAAGPQLRLENLDGARSGSVTTAGAPSNDWLVMGRIQVPETGSRKCLTPTAPATCRILPNVVHDVSTLRLHNEGDAVLVVGELAINGQFALQAPTTLPASVPPGGAVDVQVRFIAQDEGLRGGLYGGALAIVSNDAETPTRVVQLAGFWQYSSEVDFRNPSWPSTEPTVAELVRLFGYRFQVDGPWKAIKNQGLVEAVGDEVVSAYWRRADATKQVQVVQLAAYHGQGTVNTANGVLAGGESLSWFARGTDDLHRLLFHDHSEGQSLFPHLDDGQQTTVGSTYAATTFVPGSEPFGFKSNASSDPTKNSADKCDLGNLGEMSTATVKHSARSGHHMRWWPVRDGAGQLIPDTYWMIMDYYSTAVGTLVNYDFQDNIFLVSNVRPEGATASRQPGEAQALYRIDTGLDFGRNYTDQQGRTWRSDESIKATAVAEPDGSRKCQVDSDQLYAPAGMPDESGGNSNPIANANGLDAMYRSYRGNTGGASRLVTYTLPMGSTGRSVDIVLHFAERFQTQAGKRVFDVRVEGQTVRAGLDIFAAAGGKDAAYQIALPNQTIADNVLTIELDATVAGSADYPSIAGIEVLCRSLCTAADDLQPPAIPSALRATGSAGAVTLNWTANAESDLRGYNLYRATTATGPFTKLNTNPLGRTATQYVDSAAPNNAVSYYHLEALDTANNVSSAAAASGGRGNAVTPTPTPSPTLTPSPTRTPGPTLTPPPPTPIGEPSASPSARPGAELRYKALIPMVAR